MTDLRRCFDDIALGEEYESPGRTVTETDIVIFAGLSGDYNVLHTDAELMKQSSFGERIAHGLLGLPLPAGPVPPAPPRAAGGGGAPREVQGADQDRRHDPAAGQGQRQEGDVRARPRPRHP